MNYQDQLDAVGAGNEIITGTPYREILDGVEKDLEMRRETHRCGKICAWAAVAVTTVIGYAQQANYIGALAHLIVTPFLAALRKDENRTRELADLLNEGLGRA